MPLYLDLSEGARRAMVDTLIGGSGDEPLYLLASSFPLESRDVFLLLTAARREALWVLFDLWIEVHWRPYVRWRDPSGRRDWI